MTIRHTEGLNIRLPLTRERGFESSSLQRRVACEPDFQGHLRGSLCDLPSARTPLLDAAHIIMDADEQLGQPVISNGLPLTKLHHAAFDAQLIGIDPNYRIHVSDRLLEIHDGPFLELGLKGIVGQVIQAPRRFEDRPDRDRLALRFEEFKKAA
jgi:putative restriction endonuclease